MKNLKVLLFIILFSSGVLLAQEGGFSYYARNDIALTSPGAMKYGLFGFDNPAMLSLIERPNMYFTWTDQSGNWDDFNRWGLFTALPHFGFSVIHEKFGDANVTDYQIATGFGDERYSLGFSYGWSNGDAIFRHSNQVVLGALYRPIKYISFGAAGFLNTDLADEGVIELAIRPMGNEKIALFGDYMFRKKNTPSINNWSAGVAIEAFPGVRVTGRYFENENFTLGVQLSLGGISFSTQGHFDKDQNHAYNSYGIRLGEYDRNPVIELAPGKKYFSVDLFGKIKYQKYKLFDDTNTLRELIVNIENASNDKSIKGIAINISGMQANKEMLWEVREKLREFKLTGKKIIIYLDNAGMNEYHFASIADNIVMDPRGILALEGFIMGRNYYKGTLEKLGIGYSEWRYFKYKSAAETFSRESMSEADREQRQKLVDDYYKLAKTEITASRNITAENFDELVNEELIFMPYEALEKGLIDRIARWDKVEELIDSLEGSGHRIVGAGSLKDNKLPHDNYWGKKPQIAVVYALGVSAMDYGLKARSLVKDIKSATNNGDVKAVVLRVDSPGGDGLAADVIAEAVRECGEIKPVIISQGYVAASGGYWMSMYADTIVAAPNTITGSIGAIGGWFYNKELKQKLGVSTDHVKRGEHADLGYGLIFPFLNLRLPDRNLNSMEEKKIEKLIKSSYYEFVIKVAGGRKLSEENVKEIGEGRVWSGYDGLENGLVDVLGGLDMAISIAKEKAGIEDDNYDIVEYPAKGLIDLSFLKPTTIVTELEESEFINNLKLRMENNGKPLLMLPMEIDLEE